MANIFQIAYAKEQMFENILNGYGKKRITTFYSDFTIAELIGGIKGIKDTLNNAKKNWKGNVDYMSELVVVLNHKIWEHYSHNQTLAKVYDKLWRETDDFCRKHFKGEELTKYYNYID